MLRAPFLDPSTIPCTSVLSRTASRREGRHGLVEGIVTDSANIALSITGEEAIPAPTDAHARGGAPEGEDAWAASGILGWQEAVLNLNTVCDRCNAVLRRGSRAAIAVRERQGPRTILCRRCLSRLAGGAGNGGGRRARRR